jgi:hypothetical protein
MAKKHSSFLLSTPTLKVDLFWVWGKKIQYWNAPGRLASGNVELCRVLVFTRQHPGKERPHLGKERHNPSILF